MISNGLEFTFYMCYITMAYKPLIQAHDTPTRKH